MLDDQQYAEDDLLQGEDEMLQENVQDYY